jgi:hypothetical protein
VKRLEIVARVRPRRPTQFVDLAVRLPVHL